MVPETGKASASAQADRRRQRVHGPFTVAGLQVLRETALRNQPWRFSTGPRTAEGKRRSAANGLNRRTNPDSRHQVQADLAGVFRILAEMGEVRRLVSARNA
jgi:hypothetical protein